MKWKNNIQEDNQLCIVCGHDCISKSSYGYRYYIGEMWKVQPCYGEVEFGWSVAHCDECLSSCVDSSGKATIIYPKGEDETFSVETWQRANDD